MQLAKVARAIFMQVALQVFCSPLQRIGAARTACVLNRVNPMPAAIAKQTGALILSDL